MTLTETLLAALLIKPKNLSAKELDRLVRSGFTGTGGGGGGDTIQPTVSITNPANGAIVARRSTVTITATASDNVGVTSVEFRINGALQCTDTTAPYSCSWRVPRTVSQTYQIQARARDQAGNVGTATVQVTAP